MLRVYFSKVISLAFILTSLTTPVTHSVTTGLMSYHIPNQYVHTVPTTVRSIEHRETRYYRIRSGDTLSKIAKHFYGNARYWPTLWNGDHVIHNPNLVFVNEVIRVPRPTTAHVTRRIPVVYTSPRHSAGTTAYTTPPVHYGGSIQQYVVDVFGGNAGCADEILMHESGLSWADVTIENPGSGAYGLPQALPGSKMASAGADWATNPLTQLRWMLGYVDSVYGGVCNAAYHDINTGTY